MNKEEFSPEAEEFIKILEEKGIPLFEFMDSYTEFSDMDFETKEELIHWYYKKITP